MPDAMHPDGAEEDLNHARALPARYYVGADMLAMERRAVFAPSWQPLAHREQLAGPGDHVIGEIAGVPVLLVRGKDGVLRAFPNVCRHRAGPLALCNGQGARSLQCKYHGWTYTLDGQLRSAPEMQDVPGFKVEDIRLPPLRVHEWQGLVFVALKNDAPEFAEVYAGISEHIAPIDLAAMRYLRSVSYDVNCNWKVYVDNYVEGYHLPHVHPGRKKKKKKKKSRPCVRHRVGAVVFVAVVPIAQQRGVVRRRRCVIIASFYPNVMLNIRNPEAALADQPHPAARTGPLPDRV